MSEPNDRADVRPTMPIAQVLPQPIASAMRDDVLRGLVPNEPRGQTGNP